MNSRLLSWLERLLLLAGLLLMGFLIYELDGREVMRHLRLVGWGILLIVGQEILAISFNTLGWWLAFPNPKPEISFATLLAARLAGDAVNYLTPTASIGGELTRTRYLRGQASSMSLLTSLAVAKVSQTVGQVGFILIGLLLVLPTAPLPPGARWGALATLLVLSAAAIFLVFGQRRGMFGPLLRLTQRLGLFHPSKDLRARLEALDAEIARLHIDASATFVLSSLSFCAGWWMGVVEICLILYFLGLPPEPRLALAIEVLSVAIDGILFFVPMKAGTQEGGKVFIFTLLGLDPGKGLVLGLLRRIRELSWAFVGLTVAARSHVGTSR